jgi:hypothetical protein
VRRDDKLGIMADNPAEKDATQPTAAGTPTAQGIFTFAEFLQSSPPDVTERVPNLVIRPGGHPRLDTPDIQLYCEGKICNGIRVFQCPDSPYLSSNLEFCFIRYTCQNCKKTMKTFALAVIRDEMGPTGRVVKLGELPTFGPPVPARVITLVGADRDLFLKGRRAELRGLGIGAFAYYRRVVEDKKGKIIEEIGKVAEKLGASVETLQLFSDAKSETHFTAAIDKVKPAIPQSLLINGHNPLTLLHSALSEGMHARTDEECLSLATSIRLVLIELAERISVALKEDAELKEAVSRLLNRKSG